jgi:hypothetical protein
MTGSVTQEWENHRMSSIPPKQDTDELVNKAAEELIKRYGTNAREEALRRAAALETAGQWPDHALALRGLTTVERLMGSTS